MSEISGNPQHRENKSLKGILCDLTSTNLHGAYK